MTAAQRLRSSLVVGVACGLLAGCGSLLRPPPPVFDPDAVRAQIASLLPAKVERRSDWAADLFSVLEVLRLEPTATHICAVLAVTEQETGFQVNPAVPGLPAIARREIDAKAASLRIPHLVVRRTLELRSPDGRSYRERLEGARTEKALNDIYEDFIGEVPLGKRLFADWNPVRTAGPMQVSIDYARRHAAAKRYPFPLPGSIRDEVFTRRGGLYFGTAHLFDYPADYDDLLYRFADFNAGQHASRNAAFQNAASLASGRPLALDGDLLIRGGDASATSRTEEAVRSLGSRLGVDDAQVRSDLERGTGADFARTRTHARVFELAEQKAARPLPRAVVPKIVLKSPKITRKLTTEWFARRVDQRYERCRARAAQTP